jgi:ABC-type transport system involved in multi-copper enzyme maturation permease subunit
VNLFRPLLATEWSAARRRPWLISLTGLGVVVVALVAALAARSDGAERIDDLRSGVAAVLLYGGLAASCALGATVVNRPIASGYAALLVATGARRDAIVVAAIAARTSALLVIMALWGVAAELASLALGAGFDGGMAVHTAAMAETMVLALAGAALASAAFAPFAAGVVALMIHITAQAVVNLKAAVDAGSIADTAASTVRAAYAFLPRVVTSPMISDLQARDEAALAAPRFQINDAVIVVPAAGWQTVLWAMVWTAIFAALTVLAFRRRPL